MVKMPALIALLVLSLPAPAALAQGDDGFLRGAGQVDVAFSYGFERFDEFWVGDQKTSSAAVGEVTRETGNVWLGWGLADGFDLVATASWVDVENDGTTHLDDERALQDGSLGFKWRLFEQRLGPGALSGLFAPAAKTPLSHYHAKTFTAIGDGQIDLRGRAILHWRCDNGAFVAVESGFDYRMEGPANEVPLNVTAGVTLFDRLTITPFWMSTNSLDGGDIGQVDMPEVEEDREQAGVALLARITPQLGFTLGWKETLDGRNTGDSQHFWAGVVWRF